MAANVGKNKKVDALVEAPTDTRQGFGTNDKAKPEGAQTSGEGNQEENTVETGRGDCNAETGRENTGLDTESKDEAAGEKGSETDSDEQEAIEATLTEAETKNEKKRREIADGVFKSHPALSVIYFTADFIPFSNLIDAYAHACLLKERTVYSIQKS